MWGWNHAVRTVIAVALAVTLWPAASEAAVERVALVVGNGGYDPRHIPPLPNPPNDARLMAGALEAVGFDVRLVIDSDIAGMRAEIEDFGKRLRRAGADAVGLFYYAGHGVESRGANYLIPVGAEIESAVEFEIDAVPARWVLAFMEAAGNRLNIVILDACRNNPFGTGRGAPQGLASMDAPSGSLIAYSAAPGQAATDGAGDNSPYTEALAARLAEPGLKLEDVFKRVRVAVEDATRGEQTPWENSSLRGDFYFVAAAAPAPTDPVTTTPSQPTPQQLAGQAYEAAERTNTAAAFRLVVEQFPGTFYAALAEEQVARLERSALQTPTVLSAEAVEDALGLTRDERRLIQAALSEAGFETGTPDGLFGPRTREAITRWQSAQATDATGYLDAGAVRTLLAAAPVGAETPDPTDPNWIEVANQPCKVWHENADKVRRLTWDGDCVGGVVTGRGKLTISFKDSWFVGFYQGNVHHGRPEGWGIFTDNGGHRYEGEFVEWDFHGQGTKTYVNGDRYEGNWIKGKRSGHGVYTWAGGQRYDGDWVRDKRTGRGVYTWANGSRYEGDFVEGARHGQGIYLSTKGTRYEGAWRDGKPHGYGVAIYSNGQEIADTWNQGCWGTKDDRWATLFATAEACGFE